MRLITGYLVVSGDGNLKATRRVPRLKWNEIAYPVAIRIPDIWGRLQPRGATVELPDPQIESAEIGRAENLPRVALADDNG